jgi:hypothetical protein
MDLGDIRHVTPDFHRVVAYAWFPWGARVVISLATVIYPSDGSVPGGISTFLWMT